MSDTTSMKLAEKSSEPNRRKEVRNTAKLKVTLTTPGGESRDVMTRDSSFSGISFVAAEAMSLGHDCHIVLENADHTFMRFVAKVIRSRNVAEGEFEIAVQFRRQIAA